MLEAVVAILRYVGLAVTGLMAVLSLFFSFTEQVEGTARNKLTKPGRAALAITIIGLVISVASNLAEDVLDSRRAQLADVRTQRLATEVSLGAEEFESVELRLTFRDRIDWQDTEFLSAKMSEVLAGHVVRENHEILAKWELTKTKPDSADPEILYVETRPEVIRDFLEQNAPALIRTPPIGLSFHGRASSLKGYEPPAALLFSQESRDPVSNVAFSIETSPREQLRYVGSQEGEGLSFVVRGRVRYSDLLGGELSLSYRFTAPGFEKIGPSAWDRRPSVVPLFASQLRRGELLLNGQRVATVFEVTAEGLSISKPNSEWDLNNNSYYTPVCKFKITRDLIVKHYNIGMTPEQQ